jgi:hypothetical protein
VIGQRIVEYLEGGRAVAGGRPPGTLVDLPSPEGGTVAYYADSAGFRPGYRVLGRSGEVDPAELAMLLACRGPATGELLAYPMMGSRNPAKGGSAPGNPGSATKGAADVRGNHRMSWFMAWSSLDWVLTSLETRP